uniref:Membrane palmitoylated protein 4 n=1 Tax=Lynx canadensis TaxID=61383 RepID=A0A667H2B6_LYNCA
GLTGLLGLIPPPASHTSHSTACKPWPGLSLLLQTFQPETLIVTLSIGHSPTVALLQVYDCLQEFKEKKLVPATTHAQTLSYEVVGILRETPKSPETQELRQILQAPHFKGATIKRHEMTGDILVARVIHGGLAERSGLLYAGDKLVEVNGVSVEGLDPEQVIHILAMSRGTIRFKVVPGSLMGPFCTYCQVYVRAMTEYWPQEDPTIPCMDARKISDLGTCAGLIPSNHLLKRKQREFWWSQPYQPHTHLKSIIYKEEFVGCDQKFFIAGFRRSMRLCRRKSHLRQQHAGVCSASGCLSASGAPYEEVVRYQRRRSDKHRLIVLVGPSGVGVNELRRQLIERNPSHFQSAVPHTTRSKKSYEMDGREYHYVSKETFESLMYGHRMLEYGEYKGHLYGTSVDAVQAVLDEGKICVMDLEPQGIQIARTHELKPYVIFIKPSNISCMKQSRKNAKIITDYFVDMKFKDEDLQEMEDLAQKMETQFGQFFDHVIVNDNLQDACAQLLSAVQKAQEEPQWVPATWVSSDTES